MTPQTTVAGVVGWTMTTVEVLQVYLPDARNWIECLTGSSATPMTWLCIAESAASKGRERPHELHGSLEQHQDRLTELNTKGYGIFACVNETDLRGRQTPNIEAVRALFVDKDRGPDGSYGALPELELTPSMVVESGNGQHAYWRLREGEPRSIFPVAQRALAATLGTDPKPVDLPRVMRVPGFIHRKGEPTEVTVRVNDDVRRYTVAEVIDQLGATRAFEAERQRGEAGSVPPDQRRQIQETLAELPQDERVRRCVAYMAALPPAVEGEGGDYRTYRAAQVGGDFALEPAEFWPVIQEYNSRCSPPWTDIELRRKMANAYRYRQKPMGYRLLDRSGPDSNGSGNEFAPDDDLGLKRGDEAELAMNLLRLCERRGPIVCTRGAIYCYDESTGVWVRHSREVARDLLVSRYHDDYIRYTNAQGDPVAKPVKLSKGALNGAFGLALGRQMYAVERFFDEPPEGLAFRNGFVAIRNGVPELLPHHPDHKCLHAVDFEYDPNAGIGEWIGFLRSVFRDDDDREQKIDLLQEFIGACLLGIATRYQKCLVLNGEGANGKSILVETVRSVFASGAVSSVDPSTWDRGEYLAQLDGTFINLCSELRTRGVIDGHEFKQAVAGEPVMARMLYGNPFQFTPLAGHLFATNDLPSTNDQSHGFWRRFVVVGFNRQFTLQDPDYREKDDLLEALKAERPGIALWALHGAARLIRRRQYTQPNTSKELADEWRQETDPVAQFANECLAATNSRTLTNKELYSAFCEWSDEVGIPERYRPKQITVSKRVRSLGFRPFRTKNGRGFYAEMTHHDA